jgi:predicted enzyme related to lactoylglutathione lyase
MPKRENAPIGAPCWVDLLISDVDRSKDFYGGLFGWEALEPNPEFGGYFMFAVDGTPVAGCMPNPGGMGLPDAWSIHLATDDSQKTIESAEAAGGRVLMPSVDIGDLGTTTMLGDPGGASFGAWQPRTFQGFGIVREFGAPGWFELATNDFRGAVNFYKDLFRLEANVVSDEPEFRYTTLRSGGEDVAGILDTSMVGTEIPPHWTVYFVADGDATVSKVVELGGTIVRPPEDSPYGRLSEVTDPGGVSFKLVGPNDRLSA